MRAVWDGGGRDGIRVDGTYYQVIGAKRGPAPAHEIPIWIGAYKPRMLRLTGRVGDGWLPSMPYLEQMGQDGRTQLAEGNRIIDEAALGPERSAHWNGGSCGDGAAPSRRGFIVHPGAHPR